MPQFLRHNGGENNMYLCTQPQLRCTFSVQHAQYPAATDSISPERVGQSQHQTKSAFLLG